jgi:hypothetical protein
MAKVGRFVTDPKAGAFCEIKFPSGEKVLVAHDKGGFKGGRVSITRSKLFGLSSEILFECDLDGVAGQRALGELTRGAEPGSAAATPLGAFVNHVKDCESAASAAEKCRALLDKR